MIGTTHAFTGSTQQSLESLWEIEKKTNDFYLEVLNVSIIGKKLLSNNKIARS